MSWADRMQAAVRDKRFTEEDIQLCKLWITDPISDFKDQIPLRNGNLAEGPNDIYLILDGIFFTKGVEEGDIPLAKACYDGIVRRVSILNRTRAESPLK